MRRLVLLVLTLLCGLGLSLTPAYAAADVITNLQADFEVRADGTVGVTYRLDYRFGSSDRHGIDFSIVHREPYGDGIHDATYAIDNIRVGSPSGAPSEFRQSTETVSGSELINLRIGDPDRTIGRTESYVISFDMTGALETHEDGTDGTYAELYRDVTIDYPYIEQYAVTVTAPGGVLETACAAGPNECSSEVSQGAARYAGTDLASGDQLTIAAKLDPAQLTNARPNLTPQPISDPRTLAVDSTTTLQADGAVEVSQVTRYRFPDDGGAVRWDIPVRRAHNDDQDQILHVTDVVVSDANGAVLPHQTDTIGGGSDQTLRVTVEPDAGALPTDGITELTLRYRVGSALYPDPDDQTRALLRWPLVVDRAEPFTEVTATYRAPGALTVDCELGETRTPCAIPAAEQTDQAAVFRLPRAEEAPGAADEQVVVRVPADAVGNPIPELGESLDRREMGRAGLALLGTVVVGAALLVGSLVGTRKPAFANHRYAGVPPGVVNAGGPTEDDPGLTTPVRFEPPDADLATAGRLLDGEYHDRHASAEIVAAAVRGVVGIQMTPFTLWRGPWADQPPERTTWLAPAIAPLTRQQGDQRPATPQELTLLVSAVRGHQPAPKEDSPLFRTQAEVKRLKRTRRLKALAGFVIIAAVLIGLAFALRPVLGAWGAGLAVFGILGAIIPCIIWANRVGRVPLSATGTALHDQIVGFRTYLTTAEAHQLRFEAGQDIYSRYLPWAVLFDITDKWTATCQQLVAAGTLPPLQTRWVDQPPERLGYLSHEMQRDLSRGVAATRAAAAASRSSYSSGSGGSSAFSGRGIRSGGGGGGTSSGSW